MKKENEWKRILVDHNHKYWDSFSKAIKHEKLIVTKEETNKELNINIHNIKKSNIMKQKINDMFKITNEYIDDDQSILEFFSLVNSTKKTKKDNNNS